MRYIKYLLLLIFAISLSTGYGQKMSNSRSVKDKAAIEKQQQETLFKSLVRDMMDAYNEGRYLQVAQYYHDDAIVSGGTTFVEGRDALDQYWEDFFSIGGKWQLTINWERHYTDYVVQRGKSVIMQRNGEKSEVEFFLHWRKVNGEWKISQDIYW